VRRDVVLIVAVSALIAPLAARQDAPQRPPSQPLTAGATAVVVDVVVRDNRGNPVTDLRKEDFRLLENGVIQEIGDVTVVGDPAAAPVRGRADAAAAGAARAAGRAFELPHRGPTFVALVFDRLSLDARARAVKGALGLVETLTPDDFVAVYVIDLSLETVQTYTNDHARLRRALDDVARRSSTLFDRDATRKIGESVKALGDADPSVPVVASAESVGRPVDTRDLGGSSVVPDAASIQTGLAWEAMVRDQQGYATTHALLAVTTGLGRVPGRKSVVFFAEGLAIPDAVLPHFKDVVTTANRGNVSVYTIDGAGLRVHSADAATGRAVRAMGAEGLAINPDGSNRSDLRMLERNEDVLRLDPRTSLTLLADQTGGFLIEGTNDLGPGLRRIEADRRFHYVLTYTPSNRNLDGTWRSITVQVPNRRVTIRARSGYLAVDSHGLLPLFAYEGPTLAALGRADAPADLPLRAAAFVFPSAGRSRLAVLAATNAAALRFETDANGRFRTDFTILVRIVNARGEVVRKASQPYRLSGAAEQLQAARRGEILFFRQPALEPGTYTLEAALHDALASLSAVHRSTFEVPASEPGRLQVSSLLLVRRAERVKPDERDKDNPLYMGDVLLYPNLGEPLQKSRDKAATFYFVATVPSGPAPQAEIEIVQDGRTVARAPVPFPAPGSSGRIEHIIQLPLEALSAGAYAVRLIVIAGRARETSETTMTIVD
jgi:VWFA-related protein